MDISKFEPIWKLISLTTFNIDLMHKNLLCIICNKLMVDACESVCDCHYCYECISEYLKHGNKHCPGGKMECKELDLIMHRDVFRNPKINYKIYQLKVPCPNDLCHSEISMSEMEGHLRVCTKQLLECSYAQIGCDNYQSSRDSILNHLNNDSIHHTHLLIKYIENLKNEIDILKSDSEKNILEICLLREELKLKDNSLWELDDKLREINNGIEVRINNERKEVKKMLDEQKTEINRLINDLSLRSSMKTIDDDVPRNVKKKKGQCDKYGDKSMLRWAKLSANIEADFLWMINGFTAKIGTDMFSESFYSNNYKLCLRLFIDGDGDIGLCCCIMKGDNDDTLDWPMRHGVTLSIINQDTSKAVGNETYQYETYTDNKAVFNRPTTEVNDCIGYYKYYFWSINDKPSILINDSIVVSCIVTDR